MAPSSRKTGLALAAASLCVALAGAKAPADSPVFEVSAGYTLYGYSDLY
jgi:hypothetical protein